MELAPARPEKLLRPGEAARLLGIPAEAMYRLIEKGALRASVTTAGGHARFRRSDLPGRVTS